LKTLLLTLLLLSINSYSKEVNTVRIYKQWHLLAKNNTLDIEKSKALPQYKNQKFIYNSLNKLISKKTVKAVISEGCEGEINKNFLSTYNGWNYKNLESEKDTKRFIDILTLVPLKLEVKYKENLLTICGDNLDLIEKNGLASSDLNAFTGYYSRLKQFKNTDARKYKLYKDSLLEGLTEEVKNPVEYSRLKAKESLNSFKKYVQIRNDHFVKAIIENIDKNPAVIIGGVHLPDLKKKLTDKKVKFKVMEVEGYPENSDKIFDEIEKVLN